MRKVLEHCPSCGKELVITRLNCSSCQTIVLGQFQSCPFCALSPESTEFLLTFVRCRGNVKEMERELGISYWTVRRKVDELVEEMQLEPTVADQENHIAQQLDILERVSKGELSATEAAEQLAR